MKTFVTVAAAAALLALAACGKGGAQDHDAAATNVVADNLATTEEAPALDANIADTNAAAGDPGVANAVTPVDAASGNATGEAGNAL